jgi:hypothetical protein
MLEAADHMQPLRAFTEDLIVRRREPNKPDLIVPHFDPADAGVNARVLLLFEAPGPKTIRQWGGSGFISSDNDDQTAANVWAVRDQVGLHEGVLAWNIVPWLLGNASVKPGSVLLGQGGMELRRLLGLLPDLRVVVLGGLKAQNGWSRYVAPHLGAPVATIPTWHPSAQSFLQQGKRAEFTLAMERAASIAS